MSLIKSRKYVVNSATDVIVEIPDITTYLVSVPATTSCEVYICMEPSIIAEYGTSSTEVFTFADNNPSADTISRTTGSWIADRFVAGMTLTVANTVSNNGTYTIASVTEGVLTLTGGGALTNETITSTATMFAGLYDAATSWFLYETIVGANISFKDKEFEYGPMGFKFHRSAGTGSIEIWVKS